MKSFLLISFCTLISIKNTLGVPDDIFLSVTLFENQNKQGPNITIDVKGCKNVPGDWNDRSSSLELYGRCLRMYKDMDCTGRMMTISPENRLWLNDLKRMHFNDMLSSVSSCKPESPMLESGRYAIQSPWDKGVLTVRRLIGGYTMLRTSKWRKDYTQQWDIEKNDDNTYLLTSRQFQHNAITYNTDTTQEYPTERVNWVIESLHNKLYVLRKHQTDLCLAMRPKMETYLTNCQKEDKAQQWMFHKIRGASEEE